MEDLTTNGCSHNSSNDVNIITMLIANGTIIFINTKINGSNLKNEVLFDNTLYIYIWYLNIIFKYNNLRQIMKYVNPINLTPSLSFSIIKKKTL